MITGLTTGQYLGGLCGQFTGATNNWNQQDGAYATADMIAGASLDLGHSASSDARRLAPSAAFRAKGLDSTGSSCR